MKSYNSKRRRKKGAQAGNENNPGLAQAVQRAAQQEQIMEQARQAEGLDEEIVMLRAALRDLDLTRQAASSPGEKIKIVQIMSLAGERLAKMLLGKQKLNEGDPDTFIKELTEALNETVEELANEE